MTLDRNKTIVLLFALTILFFALIFGLQNKTLNKSKNKLFNANPLKIEYLGTPIKTSRKGKLLFAPNPDGKTWDILQIYFPKYGGPNSIVIIDLGNDKTKILTTDSGLNFHLCSAVILPNGKLYISVLDKWLQQEICIYDSNTNELKLKALKIPDYVLGETHPLVLGTDGKIYGAGGHSNKAATAFQIDPETNTVTYYGALGPSHAPNRCWAYSVAADNRYIFVSSGKIPWYLVAYDRRTRKSTVLLETCKIGGFIKVNQLQYGCTATIFKNQGDSQLRTDYWLSGGRAIKIKDRKEKPPWHVPEDLGRFIYLSPQPEVNTALAVPDNEGSAQLWVRTRKDRSFQPEKISSNSINEMPDWKVFQFNVPLYPQEIHRLTELPDGRIFGTAGSYEGNFIYDPIANQSIHLGKIELSHYATAIFNGKVYMSGYPNSPLYIYDLARPWTAGKEISPGKIIKDDHKDSNPHRLVYLGRQHLAGTHKIYSAAVGADERIYFGGRWMRNGQGGGLGWFDTKTGEIGGFWKLFSNYQVNFLSTADKGRYLIISTHRETDYLMGKAKPDQGKLFIYDTSIQKIVREIEPVMAAKGAGLVSGTEGTRALGWTVDPADKKQRSILYSVDVTTGQVYFRKKIPSPLPISIGSNQRENFDYRLGPDKMVWTFMDNTLVRIDPANADIIPVGFIALSGRIGFSGNDIYLSGDTRLRRVKGVVNRYSDYKKGK